MSGIARKLVGVTKGAFSPEKLFGFGDNGLYIDVFNSSNRLMSGSNVATLYDLSGNGNDITRLTTGPTITTVGSTPVLQINYSTDAAMSSDNNSWISSFDDQITFCGIMVPGSRSDAGNAFWAPNITLVEARPQTVTSDCKIPFSVGKGSNRPWVGVSAEYTSDDDWINTGTILSSGTKYVFTFVIDGNDLTNYLGTSIDTSGTFAAGSPRAQVNNFRFTLGARRLDSASLSDPWDGQIGSFILIDRVLSSVEIASIQQYFLDRI